MLRIFFVHVPTDAYTQTSKQKSFYMRQWSSIQWHAKAFIGMKLNHHWKRIEGEYRKKIQLDYKLNQILAA